MARPILKMMMGRNECGADLLLGLRAEMIIDPGPEQHIEAVKQIGIMEVHAGEIVDDQTLHLGEYPIQGVAGGKSPMGLQHLHQMMEIDESRRFSLSAQSVAQSDGDLLLTAIGRTVENEIRFPVPVGETIECHEPIIYLLVCL